MNRHNNQRRRGTVTTEAALLLPLLLLMTFGALEYGWMFLRAGEVTNAARQGVRAAVRADATSGEATSAVSDVMTASGLGSSGYTVSVSAVDVEPGEAVTVQVSVPYANIELIGFPLLPVPTSLSSTAVMSKEGP